MDAQLGETTALKNRTMKVWGLALAALLAMALPGLPAEASADAAEAGLAQQQDPPPTPGQQEAQWWLPEAASDYSYQVDRLWIWIFWIVIAMFVLTEGLLVYFCIVYRRRPGHRPTYTHGNHKAEITWTVVPALMLLGIAIIQIPTWNKIKKPDWQKLRSEPGTTNMDVLGQQFKWNVRYPGTAKQFNLKDDYSNLSNLHMPFGNTAVFALRSSDVIHSVFIPAMRVKQDTVPGLRQSLWFKPNRFKLIDLKKPTVDDGKTFEGKPRKVQQFDWVYEEKEFAPGGKYFDKRIAVSVIEDYAIKQKKPDEVDTGEEGQYVVYKPGGKSKKVRVLHQGKVLQDEDGDGTESWESCDYALGYFEIACAELCGAEHHTMRAFLVVEPRASYDNWLRTKSKDFRVESVWKAWRQ